MNRQEAINRFRKEVDKQLKWTDFSFDFEMLLCSIYDDFESRTCENCKWKIGEYCIKFDDFRAIKLLDSKGCSKFERKELDYELKGNLELSVELSQLKNRDRNTLKDYVFTNCNDCINKVDDKFTEICLSCKRYYGCYFERKEDV